jgi:hypothetical protein
MSSRHARNENYLDDLHSEVHRYATLSARSDGFHVFVPCTHPGCGPVEAFFMRAKIPAKQIANSMHRKGWTFDGNKRATCPDHQPVRKEFPMKTADLNFHRCHGRANFHSRNQPESQDCPARNRASAG